MARVRPVDLGPELNIWEVKGRKLNINCNYTKCCELIRKHLTSAELAEIHKLTPFGPLIKSAKNYVRLNQLIWYLQACQVRTELTGPEEMLMVVNDRPIRYSMQEFSLITGLRCDGSEDIIEEESDLKERYFSYSAFTLQTIEDRLTSMENNRDGSPNFDRVKMACVYFVMGVLIPRWNAKTQQNRSYLSLFDNLVKTLDFPWGRLAFRQSFPHLKYQLGLIDFHKPTSHPGGFIAPFQIVAFECIKGLAAQIGVIPLNANDSSPRICNWSMLGCEDKNNRPEFTHIRSVVSGITDIQYCMTPSSTESISFYCYRYTSPDHSISYKIDEAMNDGHIVSCTVPPRYLTPPEPVEEKGAKKEPKKKSVKAKKGDLKRPSDRDSRSSPKNQPKKAKTETCCQFQEFIFEKDRAIEIRDRKIERQKRVLKRLKDQLRAMKEEAKEEAVPDNSDNHVFEEDKPQNPQPVMTYLRRRCGKSKISQQQENPEPRTPPKEENPEPHIPLDGVSGALTIFVPSKVEGVGCEDKAEGRGRVIRKSQAVSSPYWTSNLTTAQINKIIKQVGAELAPRVFAVQEFILKHFNVRRKFNIGKFDGEFFKTVYKEKEWLETQHIDVCLHGLGKIYNSNLMDRDIAFASAYFEQCVRVAADDGNEKVWKILSSFATATRKGFAGISWIDAKQVYFPVFLERHWVCVKADIEGEHLTIYDCNLPFKSDEQIAARIDPFRTVIPKLLWRIGIKNKISDRWSYSRPADSPQNSRGGDCGVYVIKTIDVALRNGEFEELNDKEISRYRGYLAASIFDDRWF